MKQQLLTTSAIFILSLSLNYGSKLEDPLNLLSISSKNLNSAITIASDVQEQEIVYLAEACYLITDTMDMNDRLDTLNQLLRLPVNESQNIVYIIKKFNLVKDDMHGWHRAKLIETLAGILPDQREHVVKGALKLITPNINGYAPSLLIEMVGKVLPNQRENVLHHALALITPNMNGLNRCKIIEGIKLVPLRFRPKFIEFCKNHHVDPTEMKEISKAKNPNYWLYKLKNFRVLQMMNFLMPY